MEHVIDRSEQLNRFRAIPSLDFQWFRDNKYEPMYFSFLGDNEVATLADWADDVYKNYPNGGISGIEMMTMLTAAIMSSGLTRVVQAGHYLGYSSLLIGMVARHMGKGGRLFSIDISEPASSYASSWINKANLNEYVRIEVADSSDPANVAKARAFLGGTPQLIYIDSSHQYVHTKAELKLWFDVLEPGGLIFMDDVSLLATEFDSTQLGGSHRAAIEFLMTVCGNGVVVNGSWNTDAGRLVYSDPCGLAIIQKPYSPVRRFNDYAAVPPPPKVSVLTVTYNHEAYIRQTVQSVLDQVTNFPFEIVIGEDCSTDRTREILLELQRAHPDKIRLLLHEQNIGPQANHASAAAACRGEYIALLEGDDYWTDPSKLQKQVDAMDAHPHWAMCFHTTRRVYEDGSRQPELIPPAWDHNEATIDDLFQSNFMNTCSIMLRNGLIGPLPAWHREISPGDWAISILHADRGPIGYVPGVMADYRVHARGAWSQASRAYQHTEILRFLSEIDHHFQGKYRTQIESYRTRLIEQLVAESDHLNNLYRSKSEEANILHARLEAQARVIDQLYPSRRK